MTVNFKQSFFLFQQKKLSFTFATQSIEQDQGPGIKSSKEVFLNNSLL